MANPPRPSERKRKLGNPGHRPLGALEQKIALDPLPASSLFALGAAGQQIWDKLASSGGLWISNDTDIFLLQLLCEQFDRRSNLLRELETDPTSRPLLMSVNEIEKSITSNLSLLGFTPVDRAKLGFAEVRGFSKIEELKKRRAELLGHQGGIDKTPGGSL